MERPSRPPRGLTTPGARRLQWGCEYAVPLPVETSGPGDVQSPGSDAWRHLPIQGLLDVAAQLWTPCQGPLVKASGRLVHGRGYQLWCWGQPCPAKVPAADQEQSTSWRTHNPRSRAPQAPCSCQLHPTAVVSAGHVHKAWWDDKGWPLPWQTSSCSLLCCYSLCWKSNQRYGNTRACLHCGTWNAISPMWKTNSRGTMPGPGKGWPISSFTASP